MRAQKFIAAAFIISLSVPSMAQKADTIQKITRSDTAFQPRYNVPAAQQFQTKAPVADTSVAYVKGEINAIDSLSRILEKNYSDSLREEIDARISAVKEAGRYAFSLFPQLKSELEAIEFSLFMMRKK